MSRASKECILALDLGTSAFKCAWVAIDGRLGPVMTVRYRLDKVDGRVTCPPERYLKAAIQALRLVRVNAEEARLLPTALGITSQAQTFVTLNRKGETVGPAVVWTDSRAVEEAEEAARHLADFAATSGFVRPSPLQFLTKVMHARKNGLAWIAGRRYLLLNEWILYCLTGEALGDTNNQGMGGFWNVRDGIWNERALKLAGITSQHLARVGPAGALCAPLSEWIQQTTGLGAIPVYSCGNDQSAAAIGAGLTDPGDLLCNFGTAMVVYGLATHPIAPVNEFQIAGAAPLPNRWFLLSDLEFGSVLQDLAKRLLPRGGVVRLIKEAFADGIDVRNLPPLRIVDGRLDLTEVPDGCRRADVARAAVELYAARFGGLLGDLSQTLGTPKRLFVAGGLSRSRAWLDLLERRYNITLQARSTEHPGLQGVERIIQETRGGACGTSV